MARYSVAELNKIIEKFNLMNVSDMREILVGVIKEASMILQLQLINYLLDEI